MREKLRLIIDDNTTKAGRRFDYFIQILIILSLIDLAMETLPDNSERTNLILRRFEMFSVFIFSIEYILRVYIAKKPLKYIFSFYGMVDLLAILPFYLRTAIDLRSLRIFRIFRIFRAFKLIRYNKAMNRFYIAYKIVKEEIMLFLMVTGIFLFLTSAGIYYFENEAQPEIFKSIPHSGWWLVVCCYLNDSWLW